MAVLEKIPKLLQAAGLEKRESQMQMIQAAKDALQKNKILCIEAPTGTGKTVSYCLASYMVKKQKQPLVISTATVTLQEQLVYKEFVLLEKILGEKINFAIAKGRRRYLCNARLNNANAQGDLLSSNDEVEKCFEQLESGKWDGDRDNLEYPISESTWSSLTTDASGCAGKRCAFFNDCAFFKARKRCQQADIVVTNHSLLLSDLELGGGALLPEPEKAIYIIDECHHLPEKSLSHFAKSAHLMSSVDWINLLNKSYAKAVELKVAQSSEQGSIATLAKEFVDLLNNLKLYIDSNQLKFTKEVWRVSESEVQGFHEFVELKNIAGKLAGYCQSTCDILQTKLEKQAATDENEFSTLLANIGFVGSRAKNFCDAWQLFFHQRQEKEPPVARWFSRVDLKKSEGMPFDFVCHTSPITAASDLQNLFWSKLCHGAVLCSATIRALGKFDDFLRRTGLNKVDKVITKAIASPFDYEQSTLVVPAMKAEPQGAMQQKHLDEVISLLPKLLTMKLGTLVLFTSKNAMEEAFAAMPDDLIDDILLQGVRGRSRLIEMHKVRIDEGKRSILFGLASFAEGIDLAGAYCEHVIIHKLPFAVPNDPIAMTRTEWLEANKLNPFMLVTLPAASIKLTQYVGRLIRHETDRGIVTILDKRLVSKFYGKSLLENLPPFKLDINKFK